jgi:ABC-type transport system substrate-binding protein
MHPFGGQLMQKRLLGILTTAAIIVAACGGATTSTAPSGSAPAASGSSEPAPSSSASGEQTLTMAMDGDLSGGLTNAADNVPTGEAAQFLFNGLYEYDEGLVPVPALAAEPATISEDGLTWTIKLREGVKFHDGTDLTADDVVQTYDLAKSPNCRYNPSLCLSTFLEKVEKVDDLTVAFTLKQKLSTFAANYLALILIESKDAVDASYAKYLEGTSALTATETKAFLDKVAAEEAKPTGPAGDDGAPTVNYPSFTAEGEGLLTKAGQELPDKTPYTTDGVLDEGGYAQAVITAVKAIDATFTADAVDALAAAYPYLDFQRNPVGTGPFKFVEFKPGESIEYAANEDYFLGAPAIKRMFIPIIKDDIAGGQALAAGQID